MLSLGFYIYTLLGTTPAPSTYAPADVIYGTPVYAVHQMDIDAAAAAIISTAGGPDLDPAAAVSDRFYDFGKIEAGRVVDHEFPIGNTGSGPLKIYEAHTTCGCTTAEFTAGEIPPGKVALMSLHFDPGFHNMRGQTVRRGIMIHTNDPHNPVLEIWVQATIQ